ncbi:MAG: hypothetical protein WD358_05910 [Nitriliruptoraceae bacterium]
MSSERDDSNVSKGTPTSVAAGLIASLGFALLWGVLAGWRPTVTLHLAPVLVVGAGCYTAWARARSDRCRAVVLASIVGATVAVAATFGLSVVGWLRGPTWFATDAARESYILIGAALIVILLSAALGCASRTSSHSTR